MEPTTATSTFTQFTSSVQWCFTSTETVRTIRDGGGALDGDLDFHGSRALFSLALCPETVRTIRDGKPRTATSTFTQLSSSVQSCFMSRDRKDYQGWEAQDGHLDFHTALELCSVLLYVQRP